MAMTFAGRDRSPYPNRYCFRMASNLEASVQREISWSSLEMWQIHTVYGLLESTSTELSWRVCAQCLPDFLQQMSSTLFDNGIWYGVESSKAKWLATYQIIHWCEPSFIAPPIPLSSCRETGGIVGFVSRQLDIGQVLKMGLLETHPPLSPVESLETIWDGCYWRRERIDSLDR